MRIFAYMHNMDRYNKATADLSPLEHGIYRMLMDAYYMAGGPIDANEDRIFTITKAIRPDFQDAARRIVAKYFTTEGDKLRNATCDEEIARIRKSSSSQAEKAKKRWAPVEPKMPRHEPRHNPRDVPQHGENDAAACAPADAAGCAGEMPSLKALEALKALPPISPPKSKRPPGDTAVGNEKYSAIFERFWTAYPAAHRGGKWPAFQKWEQLKLDNHVDRLIADVEDRKANHRKWREGYGEHASKYLNQRLWDEPIDRTPPRARRQDRASTENANSSVATRWGGDVFDANDFK